jgi:hypothetical protein
MRDEVVRRSSRKTVVIPGRQVRVDVEFFGALEQGRVEELNHELLTAAKYQPKL